MTTFSCYEAVKQRYDGEESLGAASPLERTNRGWGHHSLRVGLTPNLAVLAIFLIPSRCVSELISHLRPDRNSWRRGPDAAPVTNCSRKRSRRSSTVQRPRQRQKHDGESSPYSRDQNERLNLPETRWTAAVKNKGGKKKKNQQQQQHSSDSAFSRFCSRLQRVLLLKWPKKSLTCFLPPQIGSTTVKSSWATDVKVCIVRREATKRYFFRTGTWALWEESEKGTKEIVEKSLLAFWRALKLFCRYKMSLWWLGMIYISLSISRLLSVTPQNPSI